MSARALAESALADSDLLPGVLVLADQVWHAQLHPTPMRECRFCPATESEVHRG